VVATGRGFAAAVRASQPRIEIMRLRYSPQSPFARKVRVVAHELGIIDRLDLVLTQTRVPDAAFEAENPLAKIPVLTTDAGEHYPESSVICEYLDATFGGDRLLPATGDGRWRALTTMALADGIVAAGILARAESLRPPAQRAPEVAAFQMGKVTRGLDRFERDLAHAGDPHAVPFDMAHITIACDLGYLILRFGRDLVLAGRPALTHWYDVVTTRPSMLATDPNQSSG
jgi:glutathione S-transferase